MLHRVQAKFYFSLFPCVCSFSLCFLFLRLALEQKMHKVQFSTVKSVKRLKLAVVFTAKDDCGVCGRFEKGLTMFFFFCFRVLLHSVDGIKADRSFSHIFFLLSVFNRIVKVSVR